MYVMYSQFPPNRFHKRISISDVLHTVFRDYTTDTRQRLITSQSVTSFCERYNTHLAAVENA